MSASGYSQGVNSFENSRKRAGRIEADCFPEQLIPKTTKQVMLFLTAQTAERDWTV